MISVNGASIDFTLFPDNTTSFRYNPCCFEYNILWRYDDDRECILLWYLVNHIRENSEVTPEIVLTMPYIPNARMDRVRATDEVFTLKWFSDFINLMYFDKVVVHDPHSNVSTALINHVVSIDVENEMEQVLELLQDKNVILQGEICGNQIQGNKYHIGGYELFAFNLIYPDHKCNTHEIADTLAPFGIKTVPILEDNKVLPQTIAELVEYSKGKSTVRKEQKREGVVMRNMERNISFKVINPDFLLAEKD